MEPAMVLGVIGLFIQAASFVVAGVWIVGKVRTESELNRAAVKNLNNSLDSLSMVNKELTLAIRHIDNRVTVLETVAKIVDASE